VVCSIPAFRAVKGRFPQAKITALVSKEGEEVLKKNPFIDEILVFKSHWFSRGNKFNPFEYFKMVSELKKRNFDLGYDLRGDVRNILLMYFGQVKYQIGYGIGGGNAFLNEAKDYEADFHQAQLNLKLIQDQIVRLDQIKPEIYFSAEEREEAKTILEQANVEPQDIVIAIHPEAGNKAKEWEEQKIIELTQRLAALSHHKILILGISRAKKIAEQISLPNVIDFTEKISLRQMIAILTRTHLFIGHDSGPSHIAQALAIPSIVIASGTNEYHKWGIWQKMSKVIQHKVECSPCHLTTCIVEGHPCMSNIEIEDVFNAVTELFTEISK